MSCIEENASTSADVNVSIYNWNNLILTNLRQKLEMGKTKSKQSKTWNTSRWPHNGKQVSLVAK